MADLNDYHAFTNTSSGSDSGSTGCSSGFIWVLAVIGILYFIGKFCG